MTDYASAISRVIPGTFVPDLGTGAETPTVSPIPGGTDTSGAATSFKDTVKKLMADVNDKLVASDQASKDLATGKTTDIDKVVTSVEEANLSLQYAMAIRSKLISAYQTISQMQV